MEKIIEKISSYNLLNNILPGVIVLKLAEWVYQVTLLGEDLFENLFVYYFVGMITSRIGSVLIEKFLLKVRFVKYEPYAKYISACKTDEKISLLLETNNVYRTFIAVFFIGLLFMFHSFVVIDIWQLDWKWSTLIILALFFILFLFSFRKQTEYIVGRIQKANGDFEEEK